MEKKKVLCKVCKKECFTGKRGLCDYHYSKSLEEKAKERRKKVREKARNTITVKKLDSLFSKVVRTIYPEFCHGCNNPLPYSQLQAAHIQSRKYYAFRFDIRNVLPACLHCNFYDPGHQISLANYSNCYYDDDILSLKIREARNAVKKLSKSEIEELHQYYTEALALMNNLDDKSKHIYRLKIVKELINKNLYVNL